MSLVFATAMRENGHVRGLILCGWQVIGFDDAPFCTKPRVRGTGVAHPPIPRIECLPAPEKTKYTGIQHRIPPVLFAQAPVVAVRLLSSGSRVDILGVVMTALRWVLPPGSVMHAKGARPTLL